MIFEEEVIAHFGVKGMRWGQRKRRPLREAADVEGLKKAKRKEVAKVAGVFAASVALGVGMAMGTRALNNRGSTQLSLIRGKPTTRLGAEFAFDAMRKAGATKLSDIPKSRDISPEAAKTIAGIVARHNESLKKANAALRDTDNALNIPLKSRSYLKEWT